MPRPQPVILPGPSGMGGSFKKTETNLQLDKVAALLGFIQDRVNASNANKQNEAAGADMLKMLGLNKQEPKPTFESSPVQTSPDGGLVNMPAQMNTNYNDYSAIGKSEYGRTVLKDIVKEREQGKHTGQTAAPHTVDIYDPNRKDTYRYQLAPNGTMKELGIAPPKEFADKYNPQSDVAEHIKKKYGMDALQEWVYRMQIAPNPTAGIITPPEQVMKDIDEKYGKGRKPGKEPKAFTPALASDYLKKYGSRAKAEEAAKKDGYTW